MMAGDRQLVRNAIAAYFGGTLVTADAGTAYQGGPLTAYGLGTAYPYSVKGIPDQYFTEGQPAGQGWGVVLGITKVMRVTKRDSYGGATSGWRARRYRIICELALICELPHIEVAGAGLDDLIDQVHALIYADRTLGTTSATYAAQGGRLIVEAGENPFGIEDQTDKFQPLDSAKGRYTGDATVTFEALTMVSA
jgi:hypothetical protein